MNILNEKGLGQLIRCQIFQACIERGRCVGLNMAWKRKVSGGVLAVIGYMLSPLSWWNDLFVNVPLALAFAWLISLLYKPAFGPALVLGYWLTNVAGLILLHKGAQRMLTDQQKGYSRRDLLRDVGISLLYTLVIVALIKFGVLKPIQSYFRAK
jgi:hypothetical protein